MRVLTSPKLKHFYQILFLYLFTLTLYRFIFYIVFKNELQNQSFQSILNSFLLGARFDLRLSIFLLIPTILISLLPLKALAIKIENIFIFVLIFIVNLFYAVDLGYYSYLRSRINSTVSSFFANPIISFHMVKESYPWFLIFIGILLASICFICLKHFLIDKKNIVKDANVDSKKLKFARGFIFVCILSFGGYGSLKMYPLRWSEAYNTTNAFLSNLALNPILYFVDTYSFRKSDYEIEKVKKNYDLVASYLGVKNPDLKNLNFLRSYPENMARKKMRPNIIIVIMESMAYFQTGVGGSKVNPTPNLDSLSKDSLLFTQFYTPTVATARSVFAAITSLPDISKIKTGTRNPLIVNQNTIMGQAFDYDKYYFLGGSANWGNIRGVLSYNIKDLKIFEEGSYQSPTVDVWGISDLDLFLEAKKELDQQNQKEKSFFAVIQTAGYHRPYTIPPLNKEFKIIPEDQNIKNEINKYGFESMAQYNAMRLQDYSLGKFIAEAKKSSWYDNTIFIIFGDHGLPHNNAANVLEWEKTQANGYHVPLIIHSPRYIKNGVEKKIATEMDVMPTAAGLIGIKYQTRSFGKDLFNKELDQYRFAFSYNWYPPHHLSLIDENFYFEKIPYNNNTLLFNYNKSGATNIKESEIKKHDELNALSEGLYETAKYLLYHNPKTY